VDEATAQAMADANYAILGSVTVRRAPGAAAIALSDQHKLLLGRLLLVPGARVTTDALVDALWGDAPGANPRNALQVAVSTVRRLLGDTGRVRQVIVTDGDGYRLVADVLRIDAERFRRLAERGHDLADRSPRAARAMLSEALSTWRGPLLGELGDRLWASGHVRELDSLRDQAEVDLNELRLELGEHAELEGTLRLQIDENPHDERRRGQLVRALDGAGRSAEAQLAYRAAYRDLGAVGPELRGIGERVARGRPAGTAASRPAGTASAYYGGGRPDGILLCAVLDPLARGPGDPGLGLLSLRIDQHAGTPHPLTADLLVATFDDVDAALRAADDLASEGSRPARIGVHVGGIVRLGRSLAGPGPALCRQLAVVAHPGQVLVTAAARARAAAATLLRDLGEQRFFDLGPGERVFELATERAGERFPPPATLSRLSHNLPVQTTRFIGREEELATLARMVAGGGLVTLTGAGGCGKTRLALQLAAGHVQAFAGGAWFVELAEVAMGADAAAVAAAVAHQLGLRTLPGETQRDALVRHLCDRVALLVLDNCEQIHAACAELVAALRASCPGVCLVATTRRPLRIDGEHVLNVASMAVDAGAPRGLPSDAVQLLLERAGPLPSDPSASAGTLDCAARICRALDGLPLAIELAAAQVPARGLHGVAAEVEAMMRGEQRLSQFASDDPGRPDRQRTIESAIDWGYRLLSDGEKRVLRRLAVLHGTFGDVEARSTAEFRAADAGSLQSLVDCSMVAVAPPLDGVSRLRLVEPIRAFALGQLTRADEHEHAREVHAGVYLALAIELAPRLFGPREQAGLLRLEAEHDNLRAALAWHVEHGRGREALRFVGALWWLWFSHGHLEEGCMWVQRALALDDEPSRERVRALRAGSHLAWWRGDHAQCDAYNVALERCAGAIGDEWGLAWVKMGFGATEVFRDPLKVLPLFEDSKRRFDALGRHWEAGYTLHLIGGARWFGGDERAAGEAFEEAVEIFERLGHRSVLASLRRCAGLMAARCGTPARGIALCSDALRLSDAIGDRAGSAQALNFLAAISRDEDDQQTAIARYAEALRLAREVGDLWATCWALDGLAGAARAFAEPEIAARLLAKSARLAARSWYVPSPRERALRDHDTDALRGELDAADLERAIAEGDVMGVGEVVSCALAFAARHT
jgi:predicted ATPase/DNA-binding SARP family transcriptional activator